jgi:hypothetical protein
MTWNEVGEWIITEDKTVLSISFTSGLAIKSSDIVGIKTTWNWAGFFYQYINIPPLGAIRVEEKINLSIPDPVLFIPRIYDPDYSLTFHKAKWIPSLKLTIYEDSMPIYNAADTVIFPNTKFANSVATAVAPATVSTSLLVANTARKGTLIANNTNQVMIIERGATASVATATFTLAAKTAGGLVSVYEDEDYTGAISAIAPNAAAGAWNVREFT